MLGSGFSASEVAYAQDCLSKSGSAKRRRVTGTTDGATHLKIEHSDSVPVEVYEEGVLQNGAHGSCLVDVGGNRVLVGATAELKLNALESNKSGSGR